MTTKGLSGQGIFGFGMVAGIKDRLSKNGIRATRGNESTITGECFRVEYDVSINGVDCRSHSADELFIVWFAPAADEISRMILDRLSSCHSPGPIQMVRSAEEWGWKEYGDKETGIWLELSDPYFSAATDHRVWRIRINYRIRAVSNNRLMTPEEIIRVTLELCQLINAQQSVISRFDLLYGPSFKP